MPELVVVVVVCVCVWWCVVVVVGACVGEGYGCMGMYGRYLGVSLAGPERFRRETWARKGLRCAGE